MYVLNYLNFKYFKFIVKNLDVQPTNDSLTSSCSQSDKPNESMLDNSEDDASRQDQSAASIKQNALLKKLLQNCPSADLKTLSESSESVALGDPNETSNNDITEQIVSTESNEIVSMAEEMLVSTPTIENKDNSINTSTIKASTPVPPVEKKLSYLDIRRAQLERDPTPPPEDIKPKRKRSVKRKESKNSDNNDANTDQNNSIKSKKRTRKGSQTKSEDSDSYNERVLNNVINCLNGMTSIQVIEPDVTNNLDICLPPDADLTSKKNKLKGCYGNASLCSTIDFYNTYPFGPNKASSSYAPANNSKFISKVNYYNDEFGSSIFDVKEEYFKKEPLSLYCRNIDSPESVVSASSPELLYDYPKDEYDRMKYINDIKSDDENDDDRKSPFLTYLPLRPIPKYYSKQLNYKVNDDCDSKLLQENSEKPLRMTGITIVIESVDNVKKAMKLLAKVLHLKSFYYNIEVSPNYTVTELFNEVPNIMENTTCKFCNRLLTNSSCKTEDDMDLGKDNFCSKDCLKNYHLNNIEMKEEITDDSLICDITEPELVSIFKQNEEKNDDPETIIVQEKRWKNIRYKYWNTNTFKNENDKIESNNQSEQSIEDSFDVCLKPHQNAVETRCCIFCGQLGDGNGEGPSRLLNMDIDKWIHCNCALWSNEVYEGFNGALINVDLAYQRAMNCECVKCGKIGASIRCFKSRCNNSYHFPCAIEEKCFFYSNKAFYCPGHNCKNLAPNVVSFIIDRRIYVHRDEAKQIAAMLHEGDNNVLRIGSLILYSIGQLLPHQLQNFHTNTHIFPIGYNVSRFYWSARTLGKRCQYICSIGELNEWPQFFIEIIEDGFENITYKASSPQSAWEQILDSLRKIREKTKTMKIFFDSLTGEDFFGLNEPAIIRLLESLPGVDTLTDYNFKYGRSPWYELPLAINPSGCARTEPRKRIHAKRPHTLQVSSNIVRSSLQSSLTNSELSPYVKQFVHSKVSQYRKMKQEWRHNVYLGRSRIQGLGLYASKPIEKHTMIIEYIGLVIRNSIADHNEKIYEAHVCFFRFYFRMIYLKSIFS